MQTGPMTRTRRSERKYIDYKKTPKTMCEFCAFTPKSPQFVKDLGAFWLVKNIYGYDIWEGCRVLEQLMIVPKRHVDSVSELTKKEKAAYIDAVASYEAGGYSIYSRAQQSITKSVPHQHTHLIKLENKRTNFMLYFRKPHLLFFR